MGYRGRMRAFEYRAQNPVVVGRRQVIQGVFNEMKDALDVWASDDDGVVGMTGRIQLHGGSAFRLLDQRKNWPAGHPLQWTNQW